MLNPQQLAKHLAQKAPQQTQEESFREALIQSLESCVSKAIERGSLEATGGKVPLTWHLHRDTNYKMQDAIDYFDKNGWKAEYRPGVEGVVEGDLGIRSYFVLKPKD